MSLLNAHISKLSIEVIQTLNVVRHTLGSSRQTSDNQQVLERLVLAELSSLKHQALQQIQKSIRHISIHESLHSAAHHLRVLALRKSCIHDLIHNLLLVLVLGSQHLLPQIIIHTLDQITSLILEQTILVGDTNQILITSTLSTAVSKEGKERIHLLAELTNHLAVVERILQKELLSILVVADVDLSNSIVQLGILASFLQTSLQPGLDHTQTVASLTHIHQRSNGTHSHHTVE